MAKPLFRLSRRRAMVERLVPVADALLAPLVALTAPVAVLASRMGWRAPLSRRVYDAAGVALVRHHYYTPIVYPRDLDLPLDEERDLPGIDLRETAQVELLRQLSYADEFAAAVPDYDPLNPNFAASDAYILYGLLRHLKPRRVYEVGSGFSTRIAQAALARNGNTVRHLCIEPFEMPWLETSGVEVLREKVERVDLALFQDLEAGDVLFIDSSHVIRPQGDVVREYLQILPSLKPGVIVHVHDIYTPYDVHPYLVVQQRKLWNEQYLMEALLSAGGLLEVMLANYWICRRHPEAFAIPVPGFSLPPERDGCSFWMRLSRSER